MKAAELTDKSVEELNDQLHALMRDQFDYRVKKTTKNLVQSHLLRQVRHDIARVKTILNQKNRGKL